MSHYDDYLKTTHWRSIKRQALRMAHGVCVSCRQKGKRLDVHHKVYHLWNEQLEDLMVLCSSCHKKQHDDPMWYDILNSIVHVVKIQTPDFEEIASLEAADHKRQRIKTRKVESLKEEAYRQGFKI